jgi:RNA polymerase sigma factor (sigma-70 family)
MVENRSFYPWSKEDDRAVVEEMLQDSRSEKWSECRMFIEMLVQIQAKNIPSNSREDIVQDTMIRVKKSLPAFQYRSMLQTWLFIIVRSCIIDSHRKLMHVGQFMVPLGDVQDGAKQEADVLTNAISRSVEDECITHEKLRQALDALQEYVSIHAKPIRNRRILVMVLLEGRSLVQAARAVGCSAAVAGYVVREAQHFVIERLKDQ